MWGSAAYGCVGFLCFILVTRTAPQPAGSVFWWGFLAVQLTWGAGLCWRRMGLRFAASAMAVGAGMSALLTALAATGHVFPNLPPLWWIPVGSAMAAGPLLFLLESRVHPHEWKRWGEFMEHTNAWDIFTGRHVPDWRGASRRAGGAESMRT